VLIFLAYILNALRYARHGANGIGKFAVSNMWTLLLPGMMACKLLLDYSTLATQKVHAAIASGAVVQFGNNGGNPVFGNIMALGNTVFPLDEIFQFIPPYLTLCVAMLTIRSIKGVKQAILF